MNISFPFSTVISAFLLLVVSVCGADKAPTLPPYPGQPNINHALVQLGEAQKKVGSNQAEAITHLQMAALALKKSSSNKGSFRATSIRLTDQAIKHLKKKDTDTAVHEIAEAIEAVNKAGKAGAD